jgi:hypothetical protein
MVMTDSLWTLAYAFQKGVSEDPVYDLTAFLKAYLCNGTIKRRKPDHQPEHADIFSGLFASTYQNSPRKATKPYDYIFATMPQFPWYHYPTHADQMTFNEIFHDLYQQAMRSNHDFNCRFTHSMLQADAGNDPNIWWMPSLCQPEPHCLGDLLKLLGQRTELTKTRLPDVHAELRVHGIDFTAQIEFIIALITTSMSLAPRSWSLSTVGNELSKYGGYPEDEIELDSNRDTYTRFAEFPSLRRALMSIDLVEEEKRRSSDDWQIQQSMKILSLLSSAVDERIYYSTLKGEWREFLSHMKGKWPVEIKTLLLLIAAMVGCRVPLSAINWTRYHFVTVAVSVPFMKDCVLGLVAKHACGNILNTEGGQLMLCLGRHQGRRHRWRDLSLAVRDSKMPVGLIPDFTYDGQTLEEQNERLNCLGEFYSDNMLLVAL